MMLVVVINTQTNNNQEMSVSWNTSWKWTPVDLPASAVSEGGEDNSNLLLVHLPDLEIPTRLKERDKIYGSTSNNWQCPFQIKANTKSGKDITCEFHIEVYTHRSNSYNRDVTYSKKKYANIFGHYRLLLETQSLGVGHQIQYPSTKVR